MESLFQPHKFFSMELWKTLTRKLPQYFPYFNRAEPDASWSSYIVLRFEWLYPILGVVFLFLTLLLDWKTNYKKALAECRNPITKKSERMQIIEEARCVMQERNNKSPTRKDYEKITQRKNKLLKILDKVCLQTNIIPKQAGEAVEHPERGFPDTN